MGNSVAVTVAQIFQKLKPITITVGRTRSENGKAIDNLFDLVRVNMGKSKAELNTLLALAVTTQNRAEQGWLAECLRTRFYQLLHAETRARGDDSWPAVFTQFVKQLGEVDIRDGTTGCLSAIDTAALGVMNGHCVQVDPSEEAILHQPVAIVGQLVVSRSNAESRRTLTRTVTWTRSADGRTIKVLVTRPARDAYGVTLTRRLAQAKGPSYYEITNVDGEEASERQQEGASRWRTMLGRRDTKADAKQDLSDVLASVPPHESLFALGRRLITALHYQPPATLRD